MLDSCRKLAASYCSFLLPVLLPLAAAAQQPTSGKPAATGPAQQREQPSILVENPVFDFGAVPQGKIVEHVFTVKNQGNAPLRIRQIRTTCGCTVGNVTKRTIPPGETSALSIRFDTKGRQGPQSKSVFVRSNDPKQPTLTCKVVGSILKAGLSVEPASLHFQNVEPGKSHEKIITVKAKPGRPLTVRDVASSLPYLSATLLPAPPAGGGGLRIRVRLAAEAPLGIFSGEVRFTVDAERKSEYQVPVSGRIVGDLVFNPATLSLGRLRTNRPYSWSIFLHAIRKRDVAVTKVESAEGKLTLELRALKPGRHYRITAQPAGPGTSGERLEDTIRIHTDSPTEPLVEIPVSGKYR